MQSTISVHAINRFGRRNGASGIQSREPLSLDQIREAAPSVFAGDRHSSRSARYTYIPTSQIVEHLMRADYGVFAVNQGGSRDADKRDFTKHLLRFRPLAQPLQVGGTHNEIVLVNSHDGTSAYRLMAGVFRLVCSNGMIVAESMIEDVRIKHSGNVLAEVAEGVDRLRDQLPLIGGTIQAMRAIDLTPDERGVFARAALTAKYGDEPPVTPEAILSARRIEDREPTLWNTLNVVQEALIRGGQRYVKRTEKGVSRRTTSPVNSVDGTTNVNRALWQLAQEMGRLKTLGA
jgi:Domain of unknown function (DUF932)